MNRCFFLVLYFISCNWVLNAQSDLLGEIEADAEELHFEYPAFKAMKIANLQSTKVAAQGDLYLYVSHRFGSVKDGVSTFFGLDNASTKIQLVYGIANGLQLGISRESFGKTYAGSLKIKLLNQGNARPFNLTAYGTVNINTQLEASRFPFLKKSDRYSYASQVILSRRFSNQLSLAIAPTYIRQNAVMEREQSHNQFAIGIGGRYKLTKRMSINADYTFNASRVENSIFYNPLSIGVDIETGGHVFQLLFSNSQSTNEPSFMTQASGDWSSGDIFFGFNIVRVF